MDVTSAREKLNPTYKTIHKYFEDLFTAIEDPEVLAWELYAEDIISSPVRDAAAYVKHERDVRASNLLKAVESRIKVDPRVFDVFLSVLAKRPSMSHLCGRIRDACGKPIDNTYLYRGWLYCHTISGPPQNRSPRTIHGTVDGPP